MTISALRYAEADDLVTAAALAWIDLDSRCRLITRRNLQMVWINSVAETSLAANGPLEMSDGRVMAANAAQQHTLLDALATVDQQPRSCILKSRDDTEVFALTLQRVTGGADPLVGLSFTSGGHLCETGGQALRDAFQLTRAETRVLILMLNGNMAREVSAALDVGLETVRTHIRQIYAKMGVKSREAMFRRVLPVCW